jgi:DNA-binding transcriptional LysR family regulator
MDPRKLEHFLAVIEHGQFNLAAEATGVSQQAVSKAIAKLEDELGVPLFERSAFGATPTVFGRALERRAQTILAETRLANAELNALSGAKLGTLSLGVGLTVARGIMARAIHRFRAQRPGIGISATVDISQVLFQQLLRGEIDIAVSSPPEYVEVPPDITTAPLFIEKDMLMVRAGHPLASRQTVALADLVPYPWLAPRNNHGIWLRICQAFAAAGIAPPQDVVRTDSAPLVLGLLAEEDCVCLLGREMMRHELGRGELVALDVPALCPSRPAILSYRSKGPLSPAAKAFIPLLREVCHDTHGPPP